MATLLCIGGCGEDAGGGGLAPPSLPDTYKPPKDVAVVTPDAGTPEVFYPPPPCQLGIKDPAEGLHVHGVVSIAAAAAHESLDMDRAVASVVRCDTEGADPIVLGEKPKSEWNGIDFTFDWDTEGLETGEYCIQVQAAAVSPTEQASDAPTCGAGRRVFVDNSCPAIGWVSPVDAGVDADGKPTGTYLRHMPIEFDTIDHTRVASARLLGPSNEVLRDFELVDDGNGLQHIADTIDVCAYGTGVLTFTVELTDEFGPPCLEEVKPRIVRCPAFVTADEYPPAESHKPVHMDDYDYDGDGANDIVAATGSGVVVYRNDGDGRLEAPLPLPGLNKAVRFVIPDDVNGDGKTDIIAIHNLGDASAATVYLWATVCQPDPAFDPTTYADDQLPPLHPVICSERFAETEVKPLPAAVTAQLYGNLADDPNASGATGKRKDLILGTVDGKHTIAVLLRAEGPDTTWEEDGETKSAPLCTYWQKQWGPLGEELPPAEHQVTACFRDPIFHAGVGNVNDIAMGNFVEDEFGNALDIVVSHNEAALITVFQHDGTGHFKAGFSWPDLAPHHATRVIAGSFNLDGTTQDPQHVDLMLLIPEIGQIWQIFGTGDGGFQKAGHPETGQPYTLRRAICVEGTPRDMVLEFMNDSQVTSKTLDLVVANSSAGTLWNLFGVQGIGKSGMVFETPRVVDITGGPQQIVITHLNGDPYWDVVTRSASGLIAVAYGALPPESGVDVTNPLAGDEGTFIAAGSITTPIPAQASGGTHSCEQSSQGADGVKASLGTPEDRLSPRHMTLADFDGDDKLDMVVVTERSKVVTVEGAGAAVVPILTYKSDGIAPRIFAGQSTARPVTSFCVPGVEECELEFGPPKGIVNALNHGSFDIGQSNDLVYVTNTYYPSTDNPGEAASEFPELPSIDVMYNDGSGSFSQSSKTSDNPQFLEEPGDFLDYGFKGGSRPKAVTVLHCNVAGDPFADYAVVAERQTDNETRSILRVFQASPNQKTFNLVWNHTFTPGKSALGITATKLGSFDEEGDTLTDLLVVTPIGVEIFHGVNTFCGFQPAGNVEVGTGVRAAAARDLDGDNMADIVAARSDGVVAVLYGLDTVAFAPPDFTLSVPDGDLQQVDISDINGDGRRDIAVLDDGALVVFLGLGGTMGFWPEGYRIPVGSGSSSLAVRDLDEDGCVDVLTLSPTTKAVTFLRNKTGLAATCAEDVYLPL